MPTSTEAEPERDAIYGLLALGDVEMGLPLSSLREVVKCPDELAALPSTSPAVCGAMELRSLIIPVIDLSVGMGMPVSDRRAQVVVIMSHKDRLIGVLVDAVRGVTHVREADLQAVQASGDNVLVSHTFQQPNGRVTSVIDAEAILSIPGLPTVSASRESSDVRLEEARRARHKRKLTLLQCGPFRLALDIVNVDTTLPGSVAQKSVLAGGACSGITVFRDLEVPVLDPLLLLGLGKMSAERSGANLVLELERGYLVVAITSLLEIVDVEESEILPLANVSLAHPEFVSGVVDVEGRGLCFVLNIDGMRSDEKLLALSSLNTPVGGEAESEVKNTAMSASQRTAQASGEVGGAYMEYVAGVQLATPLEQIDEIIPFPSTFTSTSVGGSVEGLIVHRKNAMPMMSLRDLLGLEPTTGDQCLMVITTDHGQVAVIIDHLLVVDKTTWRERQTGNSAGVNRTGEVLSGCELVQIGEDPQLVADLDLRALLNSVMTPALV